MKSYLLRLENEYFEMLRKLAYEDHRSINYIINKIIKDYLSK